MSEIFDLDEKQKAKLAKSLRRYFPDPSLKDVTPYFALLAAVEETGHDIDISYSDFIRAVVQLVQYEGFMPKGTQTPSLTLEKEVRTQAKNYLKDIKLNSSQKMKISAYNMWEKVRTSFTGGDYRPIVLDIDGAENFQLTRELQMDPNPTGTGTSAAEVKTRSDTNAGVQPHPKFSCEALF